VIAPRKGKVSSLSETCNKSDILVPFNHTALRHPHYLSGIVCQRNDDNPVFIYETDPTPTNYRKMQCRTAKSMCNVCFNPEWRGLFRCACSGFFCVGRDKRAQNGSIEVFLQGKDQHRNG